LHVFIEISNKNVKTDQLPPSDFGNCVLYLNFIAVSKFVVINPLSAYVSIGAANQDVADSQPMIEEIPCHMRSEVPARNTGELGDVNASSYRGLRIAKAPSTSGLRCFVAASRGKHRRQPVPQPDAVPVSAWWLCARSVCGHGAG